MGDFGKRGGTSATAGKKARMLIDPISGDKVRTFQAGDWLAVIQMDESAKPLVSVHPTEVDARSRVARISAAIADDHRRFPAIYPEGRPEVEYVVQARVA